MLGSISDLEDVDLIQKYAIGEEDWGITRNPIEAARERETWPNTQSLRHALWVNLAERMHRDHRTFSCHTTRTEFGFASLNYPVNAHAVRQATCRKRQQGPGML